MRKSTSDLWKEKVIENLEKYNNKLSVKFINDNKQQIELYNEKEIFAKDLLLFEIEIDMIGGPITTVRILHGDIIFDEAGRLYEEFIKYIDFVTEQTYIQMKSYIKDYINKISNEKRTYTLQSIKSETLYDYRKNMDNRNMYEIVIDNEFHKVYYEIKYTFDYVQNSF